jgi:beta-mannosidase
MTKRDMKLSDWYLSFRGKGLKCTPPCSLYSTLLEHSLIEHPFIGTNEYKTCELSNEDYEFSTEFTVGKELLGYKNIVLRFYSLDTLCTIKLNGEVLANTDNMHRIYEFQVKERLAQGENRLCVYISSPVKYMEERNKKHFLWSPPFSIPGMAHLRKANYMAGWDWGPTLPDMGIYGDVVLYAYNDNTLDNMLIRQNHLSGAVDLDFTLEGKGSFENTYARILVSHGKDTYSCEIKGVRGSLRIDNPKLWWPNGYGEQNLYNIKAELYENGKVIDTLEKTIGLRTVSISTGQDKYGRDFAFVVNGVKIFAMGADYIPQDSIIPFVTEERTERLIRDCALANFNMLRVWGGGYYPDDCFYDFCDKYGIIAWQDFMIGCANVRLSAGFRETIKAEFIDVLKRIRHHACLGLLCGNNEMELALHTWKVSESELVKSEYLELYEKMLPDICDEYAPESFYWPSSPSSGGGFVEPNDLTSGDTHYWVVWNNRPIEEYRNEYVRFSSEYGFQSYPSMKTIRSFADEKDLNPFSRVLDSHQKQNQGNYKMLKLCSEYYLYAPDFEKLIYITQLAQVNAIKYGVEHFRRFKGRCNGSLYWQLNDCWPGTSWSSIDYYGRWKALHYAAKRFYAPVLLSAHEDGYNVVLNISNETLRTFKGKVCYAVKDNNFTEIKSGQSEAEVKSAGSRDIIELDLTEYIKGFENNRYLEYSLIDNDNRLVSSNVMLFIKPKHYEFNKPEIKVDIRKDGNVAYFTVSSDTFAMDVGIDFKNLDLVLSDNFFSISSKSNVVVTAETDETVETLKENLTVISLYDVR